MLLRIILYWSTNTTWTFGYHWDFMMSNLWAVLDLVASLKIV